jgi:hypothetical protein
VRKLWIARVLFVLAGGGLAAVVIDERREQEGGGAPLRNIYVPAGQRHAIDLQVDRGEPPRPFSTTPYAHRSAERPAPQSRPAAP